VPPAGAFGQQDPAHLTAAHPDALGLGSLGKRVQGPVRRRLGILRRQQPLTALDQPAGRFTAGQLDDPAALVLADASTQARAAPRAAAATPARSP